MKTSVCFSFQNGAMIKGLMQYERQRAYSIHWTSVKNKTTLGAHIYCFTVLPSNALTQCSAIIWYPRVSWVCLFCTSGNYLHLAQKMQCHRRTITIHNPPKGLLNNLATAASLSHFIVYMSCISLSIVNGVAAPLLYYHTEH